MSAKTAITLLGQRRFLPLLVGTTLGAFNDNMFKMALVIAATEGMFSFAGMTTAELAPMAANTFTAAIFLFSAIAGQVGDRYERSMILKRTKFMEITLMILAATGFLTMNGYLLLFTLFLMGMQSAFFSPAKVASMPHYLKDEELVAGNAVMGGFLFMAILVGGALGTLLIPGENGRYIIGATLITMAIIGWLTMRLTPSSPAADENSNINWNFIAETFKILGLALRTPGMARPLLATAWFWAIAAGVVVLLHGMVTSILGQDENLTAAMQVLFTLGAATGSISCGIFSKGKEANAFSIAGALGVTVFTGDLAWQLMHWQTGPLLEITDFLQDPSHWRLLADFFFAAMFAGMFVVPQQALAQKRAPEAVRARILAGGLLINAAAATSAQLLLMLNASLGGTPANVFAFVALGSLIVAGIIIRRITSTAGDSPS